MLEITDSLEAQQPVEAWVADQWATASDDEVEAIQSFRTKVSFRVRRDSARLHAERSAQEAHQSGDHDQLRRGIVSLADALWWVSKDSATSPAAQLAAQLAVRELVSAAPHPRASRYRSQIANAGPTTEDRAALYEAIGLDWSSYVSLMKLIRAGIRPPREASDLPPPDLATTADALLAPPQGTTEVETPAYDASDRKRKVQAVALESFRGVPENLTLDLTKAGRAVSALVLGDNGAGKSTLVDAVEFGLQGRIGRSLSFDSPLGPAAASFATTSVPRVDVTLDDGSQVIRSLVKGENGRLSASSEDVRPGFRLAPIALKRQDILRFLDTGALARGHVFFDYFPATAHTMAIRPEEMVSRLEDEEYQLRIHRTRLTEILADEVGVRADEVTARDDLLKLLKSRYTNGHSVDRARDLGIWQEVDDRIRRPAEDLLGTTARLAQIKAERKKSKEILNPTLRRDQAALLGQALDGIGDIVTAGFREISGAPHVERIDVVFGRSGPVALDVVVELSSGRRCFPQQLFSEGYKDLLAILFFLAVAKRAAEHGQARVLILDDVFQSVDATVRSGTVEYILREFSDWQLLFTVHDRLWFEQLRGAFTRAGHQYVERELRRWTFDGGPSLTTAPDQLTTAVELQLQLGDPATICGTAGRLLEQASDQLSSHLGTSVIRRAGDRYTLGDTWPGVYKVLKKTSAGPVADQVQALYGLRNLAGAHYNEWATMLSLTEADRFGHSVVDLVEQTWCTDCYDWVARRNGAIGCQQGHLSL